MSNNPFSVRIGIFTFIFGGPTAPFMAFRGGDGVTTCLTLDPSFPISVPGYAQALAVAKKRYERYQKSAP